MKRTPLKRKSYLQSKTKLKKTKFSAKSKKVDEGKELRKELYAELEMQGINSCELRGRLGQCSGKMFPSLAHSLKRRHIKTDEEMREVIFCCIPEHEILEAMKPIDMYNLVREVITNRK